MFEVSMEGSDCDVVLGLVDGESRGYSASAVPWLLDTLLLLIGESVPRALGDAEFVGGCYGD